MQWPRVSVVIATYGKTDTLRLAVESALRQSYPDFRITIVVDGHPEQSAELASLYGDDARIAVHNLTRNMGEQSGPNNIGVALSGAELIAFLNHDDLWFPDHLQVLVEAQMASRADIVFSQAAGVSPRSEPTAGAEQCSFYLMSRLPGGRYRPFYSWVGVSNWLLKKAAFDALGGFRPARECVITTTQDFLIRARRAGFAFAYADQITSIALHSGIRPGSYLKGFDTSEHRLLARELSERSATAMRAVIVPRLGSDGSATWSDRLVRLTGVPLYLFKVGHHGLQRGRLINRLRGVRGLPALEARATSVADFARRQQRSAMPVVDSRDAAVFEGEALQPLFGEGWYPPEPWGRWASERSARLRLSLRGQPGDVVEIKLTCVLPPGRVQRLCIDIRQAAATVQWLRLDPHAGTERALTMRHRLDRTEEVVTLTIRPLLRLAQSRQGDRRHLGAGVIRLTIAGVPAG